MDISNESYYSTSYWRGLLRCCGYENPDILVITSDYVVGRPDAAFASFQLRELERKASKVD